MIRRAAVLAVFVVLTAGVTGGVWWRALTDALSRLEERGQADLALAGDRLLGQLQRYREMTVLVAGHPEVLALALDPARLSGPVDALLLRTADMTRSDELMLADATGRVLAASGPGKGTDRSATPYFKRAMQGALGFHHEIDLVTGRRFFVYAAPVFSPEGPVVGALISRIDTEAVEVIWRGEPMIVFFTDRDRRRLRVEPGRTDPGEARASAGRGGRQSPAAGRAGDRAPCRSGISTAAPTCRPMRCI